MSHSPLLPSVWDVYIKRPDGEIKIYKSRANNPDDAIYLLRELGDFIPEHREVVIRCIEVDRTSQRAA